MSERLDYAKASPGGVKALGGVYGYVTQCGLDEVLVELVYLRVSQINRVAQTGVPDAEFAAARQIFDEKELADLTVAIGLMNAYNRLAISFRRVPQAVLTAKT